MSKYIARAYEQFTKLDNAQQVKGKPKVSSRKGLAAPRNNKKIESEKNTPFGEVQSIIHMIRKNSGVNNA